MPISPTEAHYKLQSKFDADHRRISAEIDEILCQGERSYSVSQVPRQLHNVILDEYRQVGWNVRIVPDSKDGDYFEFSEQQHR